MAGYRRLWLKKNLTYCPELVDHYSVTCQGDIWRQLLKIDLSRFRPLVVLTQVVRIAPEPSLQDGPTFSAGKDDWQARHVHSSEIGQGKA